MVAEIRALDAALKGKGVTVTLKRPADGSLQTLAVRAFVRGSIADPLVGSLKQGESLVILSPSDASAWGPFKPATDFVVYLGRTCALQGPPEMVMVNDQLVRINLTIKG